MRYNRLVISRSKGSTVTTFIVGGLGKGAYSNYILYLRALGTIRDSAGSLTYPDTDQKFPLTELHFIINELIGPLLCNPSLPVSPTKV